MTLQLTSGRCPTPPGGGTAEVAGVGVTEADYNSGSLSVQTTLVAQPAVTQPVLILNRGTHAPNSRCPFLTTERIRLNTNGLSAPRTLIGLMNNSRSGYLVVGLKE